MSSSFMIMASRQDGLAEGVLEGNINIPFVDEDVVIVLPVREVGLEDGRDILQG